MVSMDIHGFGRFLYGSVMQSRYKKIDFNHFGRINCPKALHLVWSVLFIEYMRH
jgi:hypothetical protein